MFIVLIIVFILYFLMICSLKISSICSKKEEMDVLNDKVKEIL